MTIPNTASRKKWVDRISSAWREQVPSIFETGNLLEAAKAELAHGEWLVLAKEELPFSHQTANKLMAIADSDVLRNYAHGRNLPAAWTTLYELTKLTEEQFDAGIKSGAINPKMERKDVKVLRGIEPKERKKKDERGDLKTVGDWWGWVQPQLTDAAWALSRDDRSSFFSMARQHLNSLERKLAERDISLGAANADRAA